MAIDRSVMSRVSKTWFDAQRKANPEANHLVIVTKRPTLLADQAMITKLFGKTKCRSGMVALVKENDLSKFNCVRNFCKTFSI